MVVFLKVDFSFNAATRTHTYTTVSGRLLSAQQFFLQVYLHEIRQMLVY